MYSEIFLFKIFPLFRLVDAKLPSLIEAKVCEGLSSPLLLPPLACRMALLHRLLPKSPQDWGHLSRGQVINALNQFNISSSNHRNLFID